MRFLILGAIAVAAALAVLVAAAPASACACDPPGYKQAANWQLTEGDNLRITANRHTTTRAARVVGDAWLDTTTWSPGTLRAAGKTWRKDWSRKVSMFRTLSYRHGRSAVTLEFMDGEG